MRRIRTLLALALAFGLAGPAQAVVPGAMRLPALSPRYGLASWYGPGFHGRTAADGSRFSQDAMTAASRTLPLGSRVRVTNLNNGRRWCCASRIAAPMPTRGTASLM
jgi:hypothetical protein